MRVKSLSFNWKFIAYQEVTFDYLAVYMFQFVNSQPKDFDMNRNMKYKYLVIAQHLYGSIYIQGTIAQNLSNHWNTKYSYT